MTETALHRLQSDILAFLWESDPVSATGLGIHDHDHRYGQYSPAARQQILSTKKGYLAQLQTLDISALSVTERVDVNLLISHLVMEIYDEEVRRVLYRNPAHYASEALHGVQQLQVNYDLPVDQRVLAIIGRLKDMPRLLEEGMLNLRQEPEMLSPIAVSFALDSVQSGRHFLEDIVPQFSGTVPMYFKDLLESNTTALKALHLYERFLHELEPMARGSFACGKEYFDFLLQKKYLLNHTIEEVLAFGQNELQETERLLEEVARDRDASLSWQEQIRQLRSKHPQAEELLYYYKSEAERIRDFVTSEKLISLPEEETLAIMETPIFQRSILPYSGYDSPPAFGEQPIGHLWVTPMDSSMSAQEQEDRLRAHNIYDVILTNVHHAYPGHQLLFVRAHQHPSKVRHSFPDPYFAEGWPLYCEEMLYTEGLYPDSETRLFQLKDQLWRDYRVVIDAQLHLGQLSPEDAVTMLQEKVGLDRASAEAEVKRYCLFPTVATGYALGKREIIALRQEIADLEGDDFSLLKFHDTLLDFGVIPLSLLREHLLEAYQA
jgi:uncharacterized protein (DUF885 family)